MAPVTGQRQIRRRVDRSRAGGALLTLLALALVGVAALVLGLRHGYRTVGPAQLRTTPGGETVRLEGILAATPLRHRGSLELVLAALDGSARAVVEYPGATDERLLIGERLVVLGTWDGHVFVARADSLVATCTPPGGSGHC